MEKLIKKLNIKKLYNKDKKIFLILICFNILLIILGTTTNIFSKKGLIKVIIFTLLAVIEIGPVGIVYFLTKKEKIINNSNLPNMYDPIITNFMINSELKYDEKLIYEEIEDLKNRGFVEII